MFSYQHIVGDRKSVRQNIICKQSKKSFELAMKYGRKSQSVRDFRPLSVIISRNLLRPPKFVSCHQGIALHIQGLCAE